VVGGASGQSDEPAEGGAIDDGAAALGAHLAQLMFHAGPHAAEVDRIDAVEGFGRFLGGVGGWGLDTGIVERHVQPPERGDRAVDHSGDLVFGGDVTEHTESLAARAGQLVGGGAEGVFVDVGQDHGGSRLGEGLSGGQAHSGTAAADQGDLAGEVVARVHRRPISIEVGASRGFRS
jgi:hypothetical protein